jgi:hypothetical protein
VDERERKESGDIDGRTGQSRAGEAKVRLRGRASEREERVSIFGRGGDDPLRMGSSARCCGNKVRIKVRADVCAGASANREARGAGRHSARVRDE